MERILLITQARCGSTRLPGKVLMKIEGKPLLHIHLQRLKESKLITDMVVATTTNDEDEAICEIATECGFHFYRGFVNDVLDRFYQAAQPFQPDWVVRVTSDCPLLDAALVDKVISHAVNNDLDYCSNVLEPSYPDGQDVEICKYAALKTAWTDAKQTSEREHVTPYIWKNSTFKGGSLFKSDNFSEGYNYGHLRMTVDEASDFEVIKALIEKLGTQRKWTEYAEYLESNEEIKNINNAITRNAGYVQSVKHDS